MEKNPFDEQYSRQFDRHHHHDGEQDKWRQKQRRLKIKAGFNRAGLPAIVQVHNTYGSAYWRGLELKSKQASLKDDNNSHEAE